MRGGGSTFGDQATLVLERYNTISPNDVKWFLQRRGSFERYLGGLPDNSGDEANRVATVRAFRRASKPPIDPYLLGHLRERNPR
jgi:hypothetical protein